MRELASVYLKLGRRDDAMAMAEKALARCAPRDLDCLYHWTCGPKSARRWGRVTGH